jgi:hypothetical protein
MGYATVVVTVSIRDTELATGWDGDATEYAASIRATLHEVVGDDGPYVPLVQTYTADPTATEPVPSDPTVEPPTMPLRSAILTVTADMRRSYPDMSLRDAMADVRNALTLSDPPPLGAATVYDDGSLSYPAYVTVLSATDAAIESAIQAIEG